MTEFAVNLDNLSPDDFKQEQTKLCTVTAFLIGVAWEKCSFYYEDNKDIFEKMKKDCNCVIIRSLCRIRSNLMLNYTKVFSDIYYNLTNLDRQELFREDVRILQNQGIDIINIKYLVNDYIALMNKLIAENINKIKDYYPEWIRWEYIRQLFIMPKGQVEKFISAESKKFAANRSLYPYTLYINWRPREEGNILLNDKKFANVLYRQNGETFDDWSKVKDASRNVKKNIYEFISDSKSVELVVDCENSDAFKLASVLKQLDNEEISKIQRIVLYDDVHTTNAWSFLNAVTDIKIEHNIVERIKENKSLVDIKMGMGISKAYYSENITSFILLSSDSDFWGVISSLPEADFLVMVEREKCGPDIQQALEDDGTYYCFIDDFCTANIRQFKNAALIATLKSEVQSLVELDTKELLENLFTNLRMTVSEAEKINFYNKYIKKMRLETDAKGIMRIKVPED